MTLADSQTTPLAESKTDDSGNKLPDGPTEKRPKPPGGSGEPDAPSDEQKNDPHAARAILQKKRARGKALRWTITNLTNALKILTGIEHPDGAPLDIERATGLVKEAMGNANDDEQQDALDDLVQHYAAEGKYD